MDNANTTPKQDAPDDDLTYTIGVPTVWPTPRFDFGQRVLVPSTARISDVSYGRIEGLAFVADTWTWKYLVHVEYSSFRLYGAWYDESTLIIAEMST